MAIALVGSIQTGTGGQNDFSITSPSGLQQDDLLIAWEGFFNFNSTGAGGPIDAGWTQLYNSNDGSLGVWYRIVGASPPASVMFTGTGTTTILATAGLIALRGADAGTPINSSATGTSGAPNPPSVTTNRSNSWVVVIGGDPSNDSTPGTVSGYSNSTSVNVHGISTDHTSAIATKLIATGGTLENPAAWSSWATSGFGWSAVTLAIDPEIIGAVGASSGTGAASGVGRATTSATASSSGTGVASGVGRSTGIAVASSTGLGHAVGDSGGTTPGVGATSGTGAATGISDSHGIMVGSAVGTGTAAAFFPDRGAAVSHGTGAASAVGQGITDVGAFHWQGDATMEFVGTTDFISMLEGSKTSWCYSAEIHLRTIGFVAESTTSLRRGRASSRGTGRSNARPVIDNYPVQSGLIGFWPADEGPGGTVVHELVNGDHAAINSLALVDWTDDAIYQAVVLQEGCRLEAPQNSHYSAAGPYSISVWIRPHDIDASVFRRIVSWNDGTFNPQLVCVINNLGNTSISFKANADGVTDADVQSTPTVSVAPVGAKSHVVLTWQSSPASAILYVNGVNVSAASTGSLVFGRVDIDSPDHRLIYWGDRGLGDRYFHGSLDEMRIYNRVLSSGEVATLYADGLTRQG